MCRAEGSHRMVSNPLPRVKTRGYKVWRAEGSATLIKSTQFKPKP